MAGDRRTSRISEHLLFLGRYLRNPRSVGAVAPSSQALARQMVRDLKRDSAARIVELGPGTGAFTAAILDRIGAGSRFLALDVEPLFVRQVRQRWPSIECICAAAESLGAAAAERGLTPVDHIISGLPFASLPAAQTSRILDAIAATLRPGGTFTTFQYVQSYVLPPAIAFRRDMAARFGAPSSRRLVIRNLPPAWVLTWTKKM